MNHDFKTDYFSFEKPSALAAQIKELEEKIAQETEDLEANREEAKLLKQTSDRLEDSHKNNQRILGKLKRQKSVEDAERELGRQAWQLRQDIDDYNAWMAEGYRRFESIERRIRSGNLEHFQNDDGHPRRDRMLPDPPAVRLQALDRAKAAIPLFRHNRGTPEITIANAGRARGEHWWTQLLLNPFKEKK